MKPIHPSQIDVLMPFLDKFEEAEFFAGTWKTEQGYFPWFNLNAVVMEFIQVLYDNDWVTPKFNWTKWQESAKKYIESPRMIESADAMTLRKLLTTHARADRFCEGHLASMFENGHMLALLRRLRVLQSEMKQDKTHE